MMQVTEQLQDLLSDLKSFDLQAYLYDPEIYNNVAQAIRQIPKNDDYLKEYME